MLIGTYLKIDYWNSKKILHFYVYTLIMPSVTAQKYPAQKYLPWQSGPDKKVSEFSSLCSLLSVAALDLFLSHINYYWITFKKIPSLFQQQDITAWGSYQDLCRFRCGTKCNGHLFSPRISCRGYTVIHD